jgi:hypothetical protein
MEKGWISTFYNANGQNMFCKRHLHVHGDAHLKLLIMLCLVHTTKNGDTTKITMYV